MKKVAAISESEMVKTALADIAAKNGGYLRPELVVEAAKNPSNPLHNRFEWDDTEAARYYRNMQAGQLIRWIKVVIVRQETESKVVQFTTTRQYQSLEEDRGSEAGSYQPIDVIMSDQDKKTKLLSQVLRELQAYRKRYSEIAELANVWSEIDKLV